MIESLLEIFGQRAVDLIKSKVPVVSGKTRDSVRYEVTRDEDSIKLLVKGRANFQSVERGRGPAKSSNYEGFDQRLDEWMSAKGFPTKISKSGKKYYLIGDQWMTGKSLAYLINKRGDKKYRQGWSNVYMDDLERLVNELKKSLGGVIKQDLISVFK